MRLSNLFTLMAVIGATALAGCRTPQPALDQANNGAALIGVLQTQIQSFEGVRLKISEARLASVRQQRERLLSYTAEASFDDRISIASGKDDSAQLFKTLHDLADGRAQDDAKLQTQLVTVDEQFSKVLEPLPDVSSELSGAQKSLAVLGQDTTVRQRLENLASLVRDARAGVEANKKQSDDALTKAPAAPVQPDPKPSDSGGSSK